MAGAVSYGYLIVIAVLATALLLTTHRWRRARCALHRERVTRVVDQLALYRAHHAPAARPSPGTATDTGPDAEAVIAAAYAALHETTTDGGQP